MLGVKRFRFVGVTLPRDCAPEAHFGADFYPLNLERIDVACNSGFPLPARPPHALQTCYVCLLFDFYPVNLDRLLLPAVVTSHFPLVLDYCPQDQHIHYGHVMTA